MIIFSGRNNVTWPHNSSLKEMKTHHNSYHPFGKNFDYPLISQQKKLNLRLWYFKTNDSSVIKEVEDGFLKMYISPAGRVTRMHTLSFSSVLNSTPCNKILVFIIKNLELHL